MMTRVLCVALLVAFAASGLRAQEALQQPSSLDTLTSLDASQTPPSPVPPTPPTPTDYSLSPVLPGHAYGACELPGHCPLHRHGARPRHGDGELIEIMKVGYHRNMCWPKPFIYPDRRHTRAPFALMIQNGWRRQNLLGQHHFLPDSSTLNMAGQLKVQWVLTQTPQHRRSVFVVRDIDSAVTDRRLEAVRRYASKLLPVDVQVDVHDTHLLAEGRSAAMVDAINVRFAESMPQPVLPPRRDDPLSSD